jgi:hypothetical protein
MRPLNQTSVTTNPARGICHDFGKVTDPFRPVPHFAGTAVSFHPLTRQSACPTLDAFVEIESRRAHRRVVVSLTPLRGTGEAVSARLLSDVPRIAEVVERFATGIPTILDRILRGTNDALSTVVTQATNDFLDLLQDSVEGRGRQALRASRSLYELAAAALDVVSSSVEAQRYNAHRDVLLNQAAGLDLVELTLVGNERKAEAHRRKKLGRDTQVSASAAIDKYGDVFKRRWSSKDLASRARDHEIDGLYPYYRVASGVLHGSSGGVLGHHRVIEGRPVHRVGPAIELVPMALIYGIRFFSIVLDAAASGARDGAVEEMRQCLSDLQAICPNIRSSLLAFDRELWPTRPAGHNVAILARFPDRSTRWFIWDPSVGAVRAAKTPVVEGAQARSIAGLLERLDGQTPPISAVVSVALEGLLLDPASGSVWEEEAKVLVMEPDGGWASLGPINPLNPKLIDLE